MSDKIGGISAVKSKLMQIVADADSSLTPQATHVLSNWRIELWKFENDFPIVTVRVGVVNIKESVYGRNVDFNQQGHYVSYQFSLHVWHTNASDPYPKSKNACDLADKIIDSLETFTGDSSSGIVYFYNITSRESEPERGPQRMSRVIIEGYILAKRVLPSEQIINGGFETGDLTGWDSSLALVCSGDSHSGTYRAEIQYDACSGQSGWIRQSFDEPISVEWVKSFGFWSGGWCSNVSYNVIKAYINYDDETQTIKEFNNLPYYPTDGYAWCNLKDVLVSGKKIVSIKIQAFHCSMLVDDVSLMC